MRFPPGCLAIALFMFMLVLLPFFLAEAMLTALSKMGLSPQLTLAIAMGILFGGMVNIPVRRIERREPMEINRMQMFGVGRMINPTIEERQYTILSVNLGGCLIPAAVAIYEVVRLSDQSAALLFACIAATILNVAVCYKMARPIPNMGIAMSPFIPAIVAALSAYLLAPEFAPSIAFVAGVMGPLIGADLMNLGDISKISTGMASIGGAGTFDGIVLSGLVAVLLA